jgi:hypothetical protein
LCFPHLKERTVTSLRVAGVCLREGWKWNFKADHFYPNFQSCLSLKSQSRYSARTALSPLWPCWAYARLNVWITVRSCDDAICCNYVLYKIKYCKIFNETRAEVSVPTCVQYGLSSRLDCYFNVSSTIFSIILMWIFKLVIKNLRVADILILNKIPWIKIPTR